MCVCVRLVCEECGRARGKFNQYIKWEGVVPRQAAAEAHGNLIFGVVLVVVVGLWALSVLLCLSPLLVLRLLLARHVPALCVYRVYVLYTIVGAGVSQRDKVKIRRARRGLYRGHSQLRVGLAGVAVDVLSEVLNVRV